MNNDEYFKKLNKKAKAEPITLNKTTEPKPNHTLFQPYGFRTYFGMSTAVGWGIFIYFMTGFFIALLFVTSGMKGSVPFWVEIGAGAGALLILCILIGYARFRGWMERLPFKLEGWTELIHAHQMNKQKYYRRVTFSVTLKQGTTQEVINSITDAIKILNNKQNRWIKKDSLGDSRQQWNLIDHLSATGTVNNVGMGRLKKRLESEFAEIQRRTICIEKISIGYDTKDITWEPSSDTMS